jgi:hypothetical protein
MLNDKQKQFLTIFVLIALIASNLLLFFVWQESISNLEVVKSNAVNELVECGCEGFYKVPQHDLNLTDLNIGGLKQVFK